MSNEAPNGFRCKGRETNNPKMAHNRRSYRGGHASKRSAALTGEAYDTIIEAQLSQLNRHDLVSIIRTQIRRSCAGLAFSSALRSS
jgi:hypothetical protein